MASFGEHLKQIREQKGLSVEDLAQHTKISARFINAMEAENFDSLPGGVFNRGFVKSYAKYCGVDERELIAEYEATLKQRRGPELNILVTATTAPKRQTNSARLIPATGIVIVLAVVVWLFFHFRASAPEPRQNVAVQNATGQSPVGSSPSATSAISPSTTNPVLPAVLPQNTDGESTPKSESDTQDVLSHAGTGASKTDLPSSEIKSATATSAGRAGETKPANDKKVAAAATPESPTAQTSLDESSGSESKSNAGSFTLQITAKESAWFSIKQDGKEIYRKTMLPNETLRFHAKNRFDIVCGNAGGVALTLDGKAIPPLGRRGEVKTVTFERATAPSEPHP